MKFNIIYNFNCDQQDRTQSGVCACGGVRACVSPKRPEDEAERTRLSLLEDKLTDSLTLLLQLRNMVLTHKQTHYPTGRGRDALHTASQRHLVFDLLVHFLLLSMWVVSGLSFIQ